MRAFTIGLIVGIGLCGAVAFGQRGGAGTGQAAGGFPTITAPTNKAVVFRQSDLQARFQEMDAKKAGTWRILDAGSPAQAQNIGIRKASEDPPAVHPITVDVWVIQRGSGTLITGGEIVKDAAGKVSVKGGDETPIGVGDVIFIPPTVPHGILPGGQEVTWLNIRYDVVKQ